MNEALVEQGGPRMDLCGTQCEHRKTSAILIFLQKNYFFSEKNDNIRFLLSLIATISSSILPEIELFVVPDTALSSNGIRMTSCSNSVWILSY